MMPCEKHGLGLQDWQKTASNPTAHHRGARYKYWIEPRWAAVCVDYRLNTMYYAYNICYMGSQGLQNRLSTYCCSLIGLCIHVTLAVGLILEGVDSFINKAGWVIVHHWRPSRRTMVKRQFFIPTVRTKLVSRELSLFIAVVGCAIEMFDSPFVSTFELWQLFGMAQERCLRLNNEWTLETNMDFI